MDTIVAVYSVLWALTSVGVLFWDSHFEAREEKQLQKRYHAAVCMPTNMCDCPK